MKLQQPSKMELIELLRTQELSEDFVKDCIKKSEEAYEAVRKYNDMIESLKYEIEEYKIKRKADLLLIDAVKGDKFYNRKGAIRIFREIVYLGDKKERYIIFDFPNSPHCCQLADEQIYNFTKAG